MATNNFKQVDLILVTGMIRATGIFSYNRTGKKGLFDSHRYAKQDMAGRDFTSQRALRSCLFRDLVYRQATTDEARALYPHLAGSLVGLLRGVMNVEDDEARASPIKLQDAWTDIAASGLSRTRTGPDGVEQKTDSYIFQEIGTSSKPKEAKSADKLNADGDAAGDTSMFSLDNAPPRLQGLDCAISIAELAFIDLDPKGRPVARGDEKVGIVKNGMREVFRSLGVPDELDEGLFTYGKHGTKTSGILLSDAQTRALVGEAVVRLANLQGYRLGASVKTEKDSLSFAVSHADEKGTKIHGLDSFLKELKTMTFRAGWSKAAK